MSRTRKAGRRWPSGRWTSDSKLETRNLKRYPLLQTYDHLPDGFIDCELDGLQALLGGPSLIHLSGERRRPLFVSILLHGNESSGLQAVQALLRRYRGRALPRDLSLFVGNVAAAAQDMRYLPGQPDYNRIWPRGGGRGPVIAPCAETEMAAAVYRQMAERAPFAAVDVHNNNGRNPHYACVNVFKPAWLQLARRFSREVLYFTYPPGTLAMSLSALAPAVTVECGIVGDAGGAAHAADFLDDCLHLSAIPGYMPAASEIALYRSTVCVTVPLDVSIGVGSTTAQLHLPPDLESMNWRLQPAGTTLAWVTGLPGTVLDVRDAAGNDRRADYLRRVDDRVELTRSITPAMLTIDRQIIHQDCLCYLMDSLAPDRLVDKTYPGRPAP